MELCELCSITDGKNVTAELSRGKHWTGGATYRLQFETGPYFHQRGMKTSYPHVDVSIIFAATLFKVICLLYFHIPSPL